MANRATCRNEACPVAMLYVNDQQDSLSEGVTKYELTLLVVGRCVARLIEGIEEHFRSFFESDAVLLRIGSCFVLIPFKLNALQSISDVHDSILHGFWRTGQIEHLDCAEASMKGSVTEIGRPNGLAHPPGGDCRPILHPQHRLRMQTRTSNSAQLSPVG